MSSDAAVLRRLGDALGRAGGVDEIAVATLRGVIALAGVTRAGMALTMVGGRQLRFLTSDDGRLGPSPEWCLIDAYDRLPLNDAVRTGTGVVLPSSASLADTYPELAAHQDPAKVRSLVALPLGVADERLGGLLVYSSEELSTRDGDLGAVLTEVAQHVSEALWATRRHAAGSHVPADRSPDRAVPRAPSASRPLPHDATAPAAARRFVRKALQEWGAGPAVVESALLCTSEIVTNVVMHVQRSSVITAQRQGDRLVVHVDQPPSGPVPAIRPAPDDDPLVVAGRGLALVDAIADRWGTEASEENVRVWFELELADPEAPPD